MALKLPEDFEETANRRFKEADRFWQNWRNEARSDFAFVAGDQWLEDDMRLLKEQRRPPITFNYSEKMIDAVVGAEVSNRQEVTYRPRTMGVAAVAELWDNAAKWVRDEGNFADEESDAFRDALICGMGWTHMKVSFETDPDGMIDKSRVDPIDMRADPSAMKPGLIDRRYTFREWWIDESVARRQWPDSIIGADGEVNPGEAPGMDHITRGSRYEGDSDLNDADLHRGQVQVRHYECVELEPFHRVAVNGNIHEFSDAEFASVAKDVKEKNLQHVKQFKRVYYYAYFIEETMMEAGLSPTQEGFTYQCITGKRDRNKNYWYGLVRVMKDPQRWANKWLSQILHIINSNAKGGLLAEVGAFVDPAKAQEEWSSPESIVMLKEGGIEKVKPKEPTPYPSGLDKLMEFALASLPQVTGINLEALGLAAREQANVLEQSRKQAAYGLLAPIFDALKRYRKVDGRVLLDFIHRYISDGRLVRIGGPESQQVVPLTKAPDGIKFDVIVDQSPESPDIKQKTWEILNQILPAMMKAGLPITPDLLDYTPLPTSLSLKWKQYIQSQTVSPQQAQQMQTQVQQLTEENQQLQMKLRDRQAEIAMRAQEVEQKMKLQQQEHDGRMSMLLQEHTNTLAMNRQKQAADIENQIMQTMHQGLNDATGNHMDAINNLIKILGELENDANAPEPDTTVE